MCGISDRMKQADALIRESKLDRIDNEIKKALPYVKHISANGLGELFTSRHILKLLSEWTPVSESSEISVTSKIRKET